MIKILRVCHHLTFSISEMMQDMVTTQHIQYTRYYVYWPSFHGLSIISTT